jgi:hypothetical protein
MADARTSFGSRRAVLVGSALVLVVLASAWLRVPGFAQGGFASHDVAGILYNAMLLHDGELPYVADIELKSPGAFLLAFVFAGKDGTDIARLQVWANLWALASLVAIAVLAWRLFGALAAVVAAVVVALVDAHLDSMDANYVTWVQLPMVLAWAWAFAAAQREGWARLRGFALAGVLAGAALLVKQAAGPMLLALVLCAAWPQVWARSWRDGVRDALAISAGAVLVHAPLLVAYAWQGELGSLLSAYPINRWGIRYVLEGGRDGGLVALREGVLATAYFLALPLALAAFAVVPPASERARVRRVVVPLAIWTVAALVGAWVGARFYKGYFLGVLPPLAILAAAPWGVFGSRAPLRWPARVALALPIVLLVLRQGTLLIEQRRDRARPHDQGGRVIAKHLQLELPADERIWVWGWHLWDVYAMTGRRSASRIYKSLGLLTPPNDDTWRRPATPLVFVDGEPARILLEDLRAAPPGYIVLGSTVPHRQFTALRELLAELYVRDPRVKLGRVEFWRRRDLGPP